MKVSKLLPWHFWSTESGLTSLLIFALAYLFVVCALGDFSFGGLVARLLFSLVIVTGVAVTFRQRWVRFFAVVLAVAGLTLTWMGHIHQEQSLTILSAVLGMIFLFFLLAILIIQVFRTGVVTAHRIRGAIVVYLLRGGIWSFLYYIVALAIPLTRTLAMFEGLAGQLYLVITLARLVSLAVVCPSTPPKPD